MYGHWEGPFHPSGSGRDTWLELYARTFTTVELPGFAFAVKASRYLTYVLRLESPQGAIDLLMERVTRLGSPRSDPAPAAPDMQIDLDRLEATLAAFQDKVRLAVEPRQQSWFTKNSGTC